MSLLGLIVVLAVVGFLLWVIQQFVPMDPKVKLLMQITVVIALLIWVLQTTGLLATVGRVRV